MGEQGMTLTEQNFNILVGLHQSVFRHSSMLDNLTEMLEVKAGTCYLRDFTTRRSQMTVRKAIWALLLRVQENWKNIKWREKGFCLPTPLVLQFRHLLSMTRRKRETEQVHCLLFPVYAKTEVSLEDAYFVANFHLLRKAHKLLFSILIHLCVKRSLVFNLLLYYFWIYSLVL